MLKEPPARGLDIVIRKLGINVVEEVAADFPAGQIIERVRKMISLRALNNGARGIKQPLIVMLELAQKMGPIFDQEQRVSPAPSCGFEKLTCRGGF